MEKKVKMNKCLFKFLKSHGKTFDDIEFIVSEKNYRYEITKEDFLEHANDVDEIDICVGLEFVGKDFYVHTNGDFGYFEFVGLPEKPKHVINLAKELLIGEISPAVALGIKYLEN